jgi:hypothetical protein
MILSEIKDDINFLVGSTSATYENTDKLRNINIAYADVASIIWENATGWQYNDSNNSTPAIAKSSLVHNTQDVVLPSTIQRVHRVEVEDKNGIWTELIPVSIHDITLQAMPEFEKTPGLPKYYEINGTNVLLFPTPTSASCTLTSGIAFYVDKDVTPMVSDSAIPGFPTSFHRILSYAAALDFTQDEQLRKSLITRKGFLESKLAKFYSHKDIQGKKAIKPAGKRNWRKYI